MKANRLCTGLGEMLFGYKGLMMKFLPIYMSEFERCLRVIYESTPYETYTPVNINYSHDMATRFAQRGIGVSYEGGLVLGADCFPIAVRRILPEPYAEFYADQIPPLLRHVNGAEERFSKFRKDST